ncbi:hypothetical protein F4780DRAFT_603473 [Xylariomycetidae sp. FL0641]|nr:hypothetical protein F4780DRAFT_603473 [Xylariomycetidae sp. FL0641]
MEGKHGFPTTRTSTYETKIRDQLQIRKKLKKDDWPAIWQHRQSRGEKPTAIYLHGVKIPWEKAWKEIRRSGAHKATHGHPILCHTTTPTRSGGTITITSTTECTGARPAAPRFISYPVIDSAICPLCSRPSTTGATTASRECPSNTNTTAGTNTRPQSASKLRGESAANRRDLSGMSRGSPDKPSDERNTILQSHEASRPVACDVRRPSEVLPTGVHSHNLDFVRRTNHASEEDLDAGRVDPRNNEQSSTAITWEFDHYHIVARVLYLISNNLVSYHCPGDMTTVLDIVVERVPRAILTALFRSELASVKAVRQFLMQYTAYRGYRGSFEFLILSGPIDEWWIYRHGLLLLSAAVVMKSTRIVKYLLDLEALPSHIPWEQYTGSDTHPIVQAAVTGSAECLKLLVSPLEGDLELLQNHFAHVLYQLLDGKFIDLRRDHCYIPELLSKCTAGSYTVKLDLDNRHIKRMLQWFLDNDADVDGDPIWPNENFYWTSGGSLLDLVPYRSSSPGLFEVLLPYSRKYVSHITMSGICHSAKRGKETLTQYLESREVPAKWGSKQSALREALILHFALADTEDSRLDMETVRILFESWADDPDSPPLQSDVQDLLEFVCYCPTNALPGSPDFDAVICLLVKHGAVINDPNLLILNEYCSFDARKALLHHTPDLSKIGAAALAVTAYHGDYEEVQWLLRHGVNVNTEFHHDDRVITPISAASLNSVKMAQFLLSKDAKPRLNKQDTTGFDLLYQLISGDFRTTSWNCECPLEVIEFWVKFGLGLCDQSTSQRSILEASLERQSGPQLCMLLLSLGAPVPTTSGILASLIRNTNFSSHIDYHVHTSVTRLLRMGASIHAYDRISHSRMSPVQAAAEKMDQSLIEMLLSWGADINQPACIDCGHTALQALCSVETRAEAQKAQKLRMVQWMIEKGADVNAPAASSGGRTALQEAACCGDIETALLLLHNGANPNAPSGLWYYYFVRPVGSALDFAAAKGRIDMVQLLLNLGGISHEPGQTGYDRALDRAREAGHQIVEDLIRNHVATHSGAMPGEDLRMANGGNEHVSGGHDVVVIDSDSD